MVFVSPLVWRATRGTTPKPEGGRLDGRVLRGLGGSNPSGGPMNTANIPKRQD